LDDVVVTRGGKVVILPVMFEWPSDRHVSNKGWHLWAVRLFSGAVLVGLAVTEVQAQAQTNEVTGAGKAVLAGSAKSKGKSKPTISERPTVIGTTTSQKSESGNTKSDKPERPQATLTGEAAQTAQLVEKFQIARQDYLRAQKELELKSKNATEEQRVQLREKAGEALGRWREQQRSYLEEQQERVKTIKSELQADLGQRVDGAGEGGGGGRDR
jgi:hypothetical protein